MKLTEILTKENIFTKVDLKDKDEILRFAAEKIVKLFNDELVIDDIFNKLSEREQIMSTGIGLHLALPHIKSSEIDKCGIIALSLKDIVDFGSIDNQGVKFLIVWISPEKNTNINLQILSSISLIFKNDIELINNIFLAENNNEVFNLIKNKENSII